MPGKVVRVVTPRVFDFSKVAASSSQTIVAAQRIDLSIYRYATLAVRHHEGTIASPAKVDVLISCDGFTPDDPAKNFVFTGNPLALITLSGGSVAPRYYTEGLDADRIGALVSVLVVGSQSSTQVENIPTLSIDLVLKD